MKKTLAAAAVIFTLCAPVSHAATIFGDKDCGQWLNRRGDANVIWLMGYLSGINSVKASSTKGLDPLGKIQSPSQATIWMDNWGKAHPLENVTDGVYHLWQELERK